jgi:4-aminobutyrate aminotransferase-like enzyme
MHNALEFTADPAGQQWGDDREKELLKLEGLYCSHGDTVHYCDPPKIFDRCEGSFIYDMQGREFLDLQMWYSACNFGYANARLNNALKRQLDKLPQIASQYLHPEKIELAALIARDAEKKFGTKGRVHFNVGGSQAVEDSLKLVRNASGGKSLMFAFEGGYHGRTLGATAITSSYRYRRRYGHFGERAQFIPFPYQFRGPKGMTKEEYGEACVKNFERLFETEYYGVWDAKAGQSEYAAFTATLSGRSPAKSGRSRPTPAPMPRLRASRLSLRRFANGAIAAASPAAATQRTTNAPR